MVYHKPSGFSFIPASYPNFLYSCEHLVPLQGLPELTLVSARERSDETISRKARDRLHNHIIHNTGHCEEQSDEAISLQWDCRVATLLAVTGKKSFDALQQAAGRFIFIRLRSPLFWRLLRRPARQDSSQWPVHPVLHNDYARELPLAYQLTSTVAYRYWSGVERPEFRNIKRLRNEWQG